MIGSHRSISKRIKLSIAKRHFFRDETGLGDLESYVPNLEAISYLANESNTDISLSLLVSTPSELPLPLSVRARHALTRARQVHWNVRWDEAGETAGQKFVRHLFQRADSDTVYAMCCLDQYPLHVPEQFEAFVELARKLVHDDATYANGSRSVPVRLGVHEEGHELRTIHELIHSVASGCYVTTTPSWANPSPWYARFGESTSGAYFINPHAPQYPTIRNEVLARPELYNRPGFSVEYLTSLVAAQLRSVTTGYVHAVRNPFPTDVEATQESARARALITRSTHDLSGTAARDMLAHTLQNDYLRIAEFFPSERVEEVAMMMRTALS